MSTLKFAALGSVSAGTLDNNVLIERFADTLQGFITINGDYLSRPENFQFRDEINNLYHSAQDYLQSVEDEGYCDLEQLWILEQLETTLEEFSAPYCFFGAHPGDGADFGFWVDIESMKMVVVDQELVQVRDLDEVHDCENDVLLVNDHGNTTMYQRDESGELREVWSIV